MRRNDVHFDNPSDVPFTVSKTRHTYFVNYYRGKEGNRFMDSPFEKKKKEKHDFVGVPNRTLR